MFVLALVNQKGGCGKTTVAVNLAGALAELGHSTLLVDLDPQAHATMALGCAPRAGVDATIFDVLAGEGSLDDAALAASGGGWLVPSAPQLAEVEGLAPRPIPPQGGLSQRPQGPPGHLRFLDPR